MKKAPNLWNLDLLVGTCLNGPQAQIQGRWVPARMLGYFSLRYRLKLAWGVFTGRYDAVKWPGGQ